VAPRPPPFPLRPRSGVARHLLARAFTWVAVRCYARVRLEGRERLPAGPAVLCFNHQNWSDVFVLLAALPWRPRLYIFGPLEEDMTRGVRNRLIAWSDTGLPVRPDREDLRPAARSVAAILRLGAVVAVAGEGRIHLGERELLPLWSGAAHFAARSGVPLVPIAINGTGWLRLGRTVRVRVGAPLMPPSRASGRAVAELSERAWTSLHDLVQDYPDHPPPGPVGRRMTELFNDWPEGARPSAPIAPGAERSASP
jgi:1-acyl-sn-glycerol-3-phosphate acyltransferase